MTPLRRWQAEALPLAMEIVQRQAGDRRVIQACTGAGKSRLIAEIVKQTRGDVVITCPTEALVTQLAATLRASGADVGEFFGRRHVLGKRVTVACVPSFPRYVAERRESGRNPPALWIADEVHRGLSGPFVAAAAEALGAGARLGFTATPWRTGAPIDGWDSPLLYRYGLPQALADGVIVPARVIPWRADETGVDGAIVAMLDAERPEGPGIVSAETIADAHAYAEYLTACGWAARAVSGAMPRAEVAEALALAEAGELRAIVHVQLLTEGVDLPWLRWAALRRPRSALGLVQEVGRVLRTAPGKAGAIVFDPLGLAPLQAFSTPEALGALEAEAETEAERTVGPEAAAMLRLEALAVAAQAADDWAAELVQAALAIGLDVRPYRYVGADRQLPATTAQRARLAKLGERSRGPISRLPEGARKAARALALAPDALPRGAASDLIAVLSAISSAVAESVPSRPSPRDWAAAWRWGNLGPAPSLEQKHVKALGQ
jgi:superfamily II DNA or RNA helicase